MMERDELRQAAGSYVAGDLDDDDRSIFDDLQAKESDLSAEVDFWDGVRPNLRDAMRGSKAPHLGVGMLAVVKARAAREQDSGKHASKVVAGPWGWLGWVVAAAASLALAVVLLRPTPTPSLESAGYKVLAHEEDGSAVVLPIAGLAHPEWYEHGRFLPGARVGFTPDYEPLIRPFLGVSTKQVTVRNPGKGDDIRGLQVVRLVDGSPAAIAGLRPGDVITTLGECEMFSPYCIMRAYTSGGHGPGDEVELRYWRPAHDATISVTVRLAEVIE